MTVTIESKCALLFMNVWISVCLPGCLDVCHNIFGLTKTKSKIQKSDNPSIHELQCPDLGCSFLACPYIRTLYSPMLTATIDAHTFGQWSKVVHTNRKKFFEIDYLQSAPVFADMIASVKLDFQHFHSEYIKSSRDTGVSEIIINIINAERKERLRSEEILCRRRIVCGCLVVESTAPRVEKLPTASQRKAL